MLDLIFTEEAKQDLLTIRHYGLQKWGATQTKKYLIELRKTLNQLAEMPLMGVNRRLDFVDDVFSFPCASHMIYYVIQTNNIVVLALLHQSMVPEVHLNKRR